MKRSVVGTLWITLYVALALAPLLILLLARPPPGRDLWTELSVGLAFLGLSMLFLQFALTARFRRVAAPFGVDMILQFHRQISLVAVGFIVAHAAIILTTRPLGFLNVLSGPSASRAGVLALVGLLLIVALSLWRQRLGLRYEVWRTSHGVLAIAVLGLAMWHVVGSGFYVALAWKQALWGAMALAAVGLVVWIRVLRPARLLRRPWSVDEVREERGRVWTVRLRPVGHAGIRFAPGQFAWLTLGRSPYRIQEHPFSFASSAEETDHVDFGIKPLGDFTATIPEVRPGTPAYLDGPFGIFTPDRHAPSDLVLVAGGIGITPILSILRSFADRGDDRRLILLYGCKSWDRITYREEIEALKARLDLRTTYALMEPPEGWKGETGYVDQEMLARHLPSERADLRAFICGPPPMMDAVQEALQELGLPLDQIYLEHFDLV